MKHRHIHAKKGEWVHIHRDKNNGVNPIAIIIVVIIIIWLIKSC